MRVPVRIGHSESVNIQTREHLPVERALELLVAGAGSDRRGRADAARARGRDEVFVGRVRRDDSHPNGLAMFVVADNLRKGAATNAVQIAELVLASAAQRAAGVASTV